MKKNSSVLIPVVIIAIVFSIVCFWGLWKDQGLRKRFKTEDTVVDSLVRFPRGSGVWVFYRYQVAQKNYRENRQVFIGSKYLPFLKLLLLNRKMPVVYDSLDPSNSEILLLSKDFARYGLQRPDSLTALVHLLDSLKY